MRGLWLLFPIGMFAVGCVTDAKTAAPADGGAGAGADAGTAPLLPWAVGNNWTYRVTDTKSVSQKVTSIEAEELVGGSGPHADEMAFKVTTLKVDGTDRTLSWQLDQGGKVIRYREQSFSAGSGALSLEEHWDPYKLHIDGTPEHTAPNATWLEEYAETKLPAAGSPSTAQQRDRWSVDQADATVTVPAGTFEHAVVFTKAGGSDLKTYWYVRGIGKIKETGGQTEELVSYTVAP
jgi:hypothetical protein